MEKIKSFTVDHTKLEKGLYTSRIDGDVVTYDLRMCTPNAGVYLENAALHTFEHLFATYVRVINKKHSKEIIYIGPMGCRTGFYFITRISIPSGQLFALLLETLDYIAEYDGEIPGVSEAECGNYREHDLVGARKMAKEFAQVIRDRDGASLEYAEQ